MSRRDLVVRVSRLWPLLLAAGCLVVLYAVDRSAKRRSDPLTVRPADSTLRVEKAGDLLVPFVVTNEGPDPVRVIGSEVGCGRGL